MDLSNDARDSSFDFKKPMLSYVFFLTGFLAVVMFLYTFIAFLGVGGATPWPVVDTIMMQNAVPLFVWEIIFLIFHAVLLIGIAIAGNIANNNDNHGFVKFALAIIAFFDISMMIWAGLLFGSHGQLEYAVNRGYSEQNWADTEKRRALAQIPTYQCAITGPNYAQMQANRAACSEECYWYLTHWGYCVAGVCITFTSLIMLLLLYLLYASSKYGKQYGGVVDPEKLPMLSSSDDPEKKMSTVAEL